MKQLSKRLKETRHQKGLSQNEVAEYLGYKSFTTIQKWEDGSSLPSLEVLNKLCGLYEVDFNELIMGIPMIPHLGTVRGGLPIYAWQEVMTDPSQEYFYLSVVGDSMKDARIFEGDEILVQKQPTLNNGEIGVILVGEEATVKRFYQEPEGIILKPENENYEPLKYTLEEMEEIPIIILGKVISNRFNIK